LPINAQFGVFGKLGASFNHLKATASSDSAVINSQNGFPFSVSKNTNSVLLGIGAEYNISKQLAARVEYEHFGKWGDQDVTGRTTTSVLSLGVDYKFW
jgi:opacity protein-like surface antigen